MSFRNIILAVLTISLMCTNAMARDTQERSTISLGYQYGKIKDFGEMQGANVKFQYETQTPWGLMGSMTLMKKDWDNYNRTFKSIHNSREDNRNRKFKPTFNSREDKISDHYRLIKKEPIRNALYFSALAGPTYRISNNLSLFALGGVSHTVVDKPLVQGSRPNSFKKNGSESSSQFAYSAGVIFNPTDRMALNVGYEGSKAMFNKKKHDMRSVFVDVGYRF